MCNPYNTTEISCAISIGNYDTAIALLSRIPCNHKRYAYLYNRLACAMLQDVQEIGAFNDCLYRSFTLLKQPYEFTYKHIRTVKGGVIK